MVKSKVKFDLSKAEDNRNDTYGIVFKWTFLTKIKSMN